MSRALLLMVVLSLSAPCVLAHSPVAPGPCAASETAYFACLTARGKWVGLCGNPPRSLQYRFGKVGEPEFRYPEDPAEGLGGFTFAHYWRYQTDRLEIGFRNQGADYSIFDYTEGRRRQAGVRVTTADGKERTFSCKGKIVSRLAELEGFLRCYPDNALNGGQCP